MSNVINFVTAEQKQANDHYDIINDVVRRGSPEAFERQQHIMDFCHFLKSKGVFFVDDGHIIMATSLYMQYKDLVPEPRA